MIVTRKQKMLIKKWQRIKTLLKTVEKINALNEVSKFIWWRTKNKTRIFKERL